jgi:hypothetical protein
MARDTRRVWQISATETVGSCINRVASFDLSSGLGFGAASRFVDRYTRRTS